MEAIVQDVMRRMTNLETAMTIRGADGQERPLVQSFVNLEQSVIAQTDTAQLPIDAKIKSAVLAIQTGEKSSQPKQDFTKPILESKAIQDIGKLTDAKSYRQWNKKMKNALEQTRAQSRSMLEAVEKMTEEEVIEYTSTLYARIMEKLSLT